MGPAPRPPAPVEGGTASGTSISVVIPAFGRREFVKEAVRSASGEDSPEGPTEIVVIKDFEDPAIDEEVPRGGGTVLPFGSRVYGETIARAVRACRGEVVAFLEDDDRFVPGKLRRLQEVFGGLPSVDFYHNDYREIDRTGGPYPPSSQRRAIDRRVGGRGLERYDDAEKAVRFDRISATVPMAHLSCVAMRRAALERVLPRLERVPIGVDFFLFFAGLAAPGEVVIDTQKLTDYRRHAANSSRALSFDPGWYEELVAGSEELAVATRAVLQENGRSDLARHLEAELAAHAVYVATAAPTPDRRAVAGALGAMCRNPGSFRGTQRRTLFAQAGLFLASPRYAARLLRPDLEPEAKDSKGG